MPRLAWLERRQGIGQVIHHLAEAGSTNRLIADLAAAGAPAGTVVVADHQTSGRGKGERVWFSRPGGGLCLSVLLRPSRPIEEIYQATLVAAVAVTAAIARVSGVAAEVKWPNDLLARGRKLCGILSELALTPEGDLDYVIVGIGLNVGLAPMDFPEDLRGLATSVAAEAGCEVDRFALLDAILDELEDWQAIWECDGFAPVRAAWIARSCTLGRGIALQAGSTRLCGVATDLGADGALCVRDADGVTHRLHYGEISLATRQSGSARAPVQA
ncbi:Biotin-protein ligase / Biotin operon repressor [Rhodovastum atsumiense]|nr:Biotin-protein ligase / Biotin operon repressor [Rhodovastum atsumiense]